MHNISSFNTLDDRVCSYNEESEIQALKKWKNEAAVNSGENKELAFLRINNCRNSNDPFLDLNGLNLTSLDDIPSCVRCLLICRNQLTTLPSLHEGIEMLNATDNKIKYIGPLPRTLKRIFLDDYLLTNRPSIEQAGDVFEIEDGPTSSKMPAHSYIPIVKGSVFNVTDDINDCHKPRGIPKVIGHTREVIEVKDNPNANEIPKIIHFIWLGKDNLSIFSMFNIINNVKLNPKYEIKLWSDNPERTKSQFINAGYSTAVFLKVHILKPDPDPLVQSVIGLECAGAIYKNYAAASDVLRLWLLKEYGGVYMDVDIALKEPLSDELSLCKDGELREDFLSCIGSVKRLFGHGIYSNNNFLAAEKNSPTAAILLEAAINPYLTPSRRRTADTINNADLVKERYDELTKYNPSLRRKLKTTGLPPEQLLYNICSILKRYNKEMRFHFTCDLTGPGLISNYYAGRGDGFEYKDRENRENDQTLDNTTRAKAMNKIKNFGHLENVHKKGIVWVEKTDTSSSWVKLPEERKSAEV